MKTVNNIMPQICTIENAEHAYNQAKRIKRMRPEVLRFELNREENLIRAINELRSGDYTPGKYFVFKVWEPKERIIMALPFYDRVVHHMIIDKIDYIFEKRFIKHSYACRRNMGVHMASYQLARWLYDLENTQKKKIYALSGDIHHYFQSVDHSILKQEVRRYISDEHLLMLLDRIIDYNGIWPKGIGIPVGNLTSQVFANVYLNVLDQHCKHYYKCKYYMRYMDNFLILHEDASFLRMIKNELPEFLHDRLNLKLNPKSTVVYAKNGIDFVGYRHWKDFTLLRKCAMRRISDLIKHYKSGYYSDSDFHKRFVSMIGHAKHADVCEYIHKVSNMVMDLSDELGYYNERELLTNLLNKYYRQ